MEEARIDFKSALSGCSRRHTVITHFFFLSFFFFFFFYFFSLFFSRRRKIRPQWVPHRVKKKNSKLKKCEMKEN